MIVYGGGVTAGSLAESFALPLESTVNASESSLSSMRTCSV